LSGRYEVSTQTIRRDVNELCAVGELRRVRGGVAPPPHNFNNIHYSKRQVLNVGPKKMLAELVAGHIQDGASIALSVGTTPEVVIDCLRAKSGLKIFTNNLNVAMRASAQDDWVVTVPGGKLRSGDRDILGPSVEDFFHGYEVDFGIFGVAGVGAGGELFDFWEEEVAIRAAILNNCRHSFLVLDHTKFARAAHVRGGHLCDVSHVFCNALPPKHLLDQLENAPTQLFTPEVESAR
jgi:DeoR family glycerol-3-phosphate regulon repressor